MILSCSEMTGLLRQPLKQYHAHHVTLDIGSFITADIVRGFRCLV